MLQGVPGDDDAVHADPAGDVQPLGARQGKAAGRGGLGARGTPALGVVGRRGRGDAGLQGINSCSATLHCEGTEC